VEIKHNHNIETVVLLHGIGQSHRSMILLKRRLEREGYNVLSISYPSTKKTLKELALHLYDNSLDDNFWQQWDKVHFVTHSMGGLVAREYLAMYKEAIPGERLSRVVMLAPPLGGSEISDLLSSNPFFQWLFGPAGAELTTKHQSKIESDIYYELGIIAGAKAWPYFISSQVIPGANDGRVSVASTKTRAMTDHAVTNSSHAFIMNKKAVQNLIIAFLKNGAFGC
jgi:triacylglycerol lipase